MRRTTFSPPLSGKSPFLKNGLVKWQALAGVVLLAAAGANALDLVWTNTAGGNWNAPANWSPNQFPGAAGNAFISV